MLRHLIRRQGTRLSFVAAQVLFDKLVRHQFCPIHPLSLLNDTNEAKITSTVILITFSQLACNETSVSRADLFYSLRYSITHPSTTTASEEKAKPAVINCSRVIVGDSASSQLMIVQRRSDSSQCRLSVV
jgi:hypothetical protein